MKFDADVGIGGLGASSKSLLLLSVSFVNSKVGIRISLVSLFVEFWSIDSSF